MGTEEIGLGDRGVKCITDNTDCLKHWGFPTVEMFGYAKYQIKHRIFHENELFKFL
jgi:hypothetical protein